MNHVIKVNVKSHTYPILLCTDFADLGESVSTAVCDCRRICIVTDTNVSPLYADQILANLRESNRELHIYTIPAGEENKTLSHIEALYEALINWNFDRRDVLVALGGGVIGDMTGFAAATYLRGIRFIQIPTTLLADVDSSIGGKTGVDFRKYKNMVGAFHQPELVYINLSILSSLPQIQFENGMAEVIKTALILDRTFFNWLSDHRGEIHDLKPDILASMVLRCCEIKRDVVEHDETEQGERALLNFGHTIGHAVEKLKNFSLLHGQCVSLGILAADEISYRLGFLSKDQCQQIQELLAYFHLPTRTDGLSEQDILLTTKSDKKMRAGAIRFILLESIGKACISTEITDGQILSAASFILDGARS